MTNVCPNCGYGLEGRATFCPNCGQRLEPPRMTEPRMRVPPLPPPPPASWSARLTAWADRAWRRFRASQR